MRKYALLIWLLVMALFLCACGGVEESPAVPSTTTVTTTTATNQTATDTTAVTTTESTTQTTTTVTESPTVAPTTTLRPSITTTKRPTTTTTKAPVAESYRGWYDLGNCGTLTRNPTLVVLFVDDAESAWNDTLIQHFQNVQIAKAVEWLEQQAAKYGVPLDIQTKYYHGTLENGGRVYYPATIAHKPDESDYDLLESVVGNMGEGTGDQFYAKLRRDNGGEDVMFLCMVNKDGLSYARGHADPYAQMLEYAVVYARNTDVPATDALHQKTHNRASVVAHELLHLFGAEEMYDPAGRNEIAKQKYLKDVMLWTESFIARNEITEFTAYCIGWTDTIPAICYDPNWWK